MSELAYIDRFFRELERVMRDIRREDISRAVDLLFGTWRKGRSVYLMGNGGSASTATHFACDLAKVTIVNGRRRLRAMSLTDCIPLVSAWTNDNGFGSIFVEQVEPWLEAGDTLIGLSVHGGSGEGEAGQWSQNLLRAMALAKERNARTIGLAGFDGGALKEIADVCIVVPIYEEPLATPIVEAFHVVLHHLIATALRRRIEMAGPSGLVQ